MTDVDRIRQVARIADLGAVLEELVDLHPGCREAPASETAERPRCDAHDEDWPCAHERARRVLAGVPTNDVLAQLRAAAVEESIDSAAAHFGGRCCTPAEMCDELVTALLATVERLVAVHVEEPLSTEFLVVHPAILDLPLELAPDSVRAAIVYAVQHHVSVHVIEWAQAQQA